MDEIVRQAMAKWPDVPHCYGWLALDARGNWRMRDEPTQALRQPGDRISSPALIGFINRNYLHDEQGRWYFQNGPQRVYVNLELTPYIARTDPAEGFLLHTGAPMSVLDAAWLTDTGQLLLKSGECVAMVDDRDLAQCLARLRLDGAALDDERLLAWLEGKDPGRLTLAHEGADLVVERIALGEVAQRFGFEPVPQP